MKKREPPRQRKPLPHRSSRKEGSFYRSALERLKRAEDAYGRTIWIEERARDGKPNIFYRYNSKGRLMKYTRSIYGYSSTPAEISRFGDEVQIEVEKRRRKYQELRPEVGAERTTPSAEAAATPPL